jgi:hypothetical protein
MGVEIKAPSIALVVVSLKLTDPIIAGETDE